MDNAVAIDNNILQSPDLSFKAKALWAYIKSKNSSNLSVELIMEESKESYPSIASGLRELEKNGYLVREKMSDGKMEYHLYRNNDLRVKK